MVVSPATWYGQSLRYAQATLFLDSRLTRRQKDLAILRACAHIDLNHLPGEIVGAVRTADGRWRPGCPFELADVTWRQGFLGWRDRRAHRERGWRQRAMPRAYPA